MKETNYKQINFMSIAEAYQANQFKYDINILFANVASYTYWKKVWEYQTTGERTEFVKKNMLACCETKKYVENRLNSLAYKIIRTAVNVNTLLHRNELQGFLTQKFERTDEGLYRRSDAHHLAEDIADQYYDYLGIEITETNWFAKAERLSKSK